jgi:hypothetical protein
MGKLLLLILVAGGLWLGWQHHQQGREPAAASARAESALPPGKEALGARPTRLSPAAQVAPIPGVD